MVEAVWFEYVVTDLGHAKPFYAELLGCTFEQMDGYPGEYWMIAGEPVGGGLLPAAGARQPGGGACMYFRVDDVEERAALAVRLGGTIVQQLLDIEEVGRFIVVSDPDGNHIGLWTR